MGVDGGTTGGAAATSRGVMGVVATGVRQGDRGGLAEVDFQFEELPFQRQQLARIARGGTLERTRCSGALSAGRITESDQDQSDHQPRANAEAGTHRGGLRGGVADARGGSAGR